MLKVPTQEDAFDEWVDALRSDKYRQCRGIEKMPSIRRTGRWWNRKTVEDGYFYCAIGVLSELSNDKVAPLRLNEKWRALVMTWNDEDCLSFPEIATKLERRKDAILGRVKQQWYKTWKPIEIGICTIASATVSATVNCHHIYTTTSGSGGGAPGSSKTKHAEYIEYSI